MLFFFLKCFFFLFFPLQAIFLSFSPATTLYKTWNVGCMDSPAPWLCAETLLQPHTARMTDIICLLASQLNCTTSVQAGPACETASLVYSATWHCDAENVSYQLRGGNEGDVGSTKKGGKLMSLKWRWINMVARGCEKVEWEWERQREGGWNRAGVRLMVL